MPEARDRSTSAAERGALRAALGSPAARSGDVAAHLDEREIALYLSHALSTAELERCMAHAAACASCAEDLAASAAVEDEARRAGMADGDDGEAPLPSAQLLAAARGPSPAHDSPAAQHGAQTSRAATARTAAADPRRGAAGRTARRSGRGFRRIAAAAAIVAVSAIALQAGGRLAMQRLEPELVRRLSASIGRQVDIDSASLTLRDGLGIEAAGLSIADDPAFPGERFAQIEDTVVALDAAALLSGKLHGSLRLDAPTVRLARDAAGRWNVESLGAGKARAAGSLDDARRAANEARTRDAARGKGPAVRLTAASVEHGTLVISDQSTGHGRSLTLRDVDLSLSSPKATDAAALSLRGVVGPDATAFEVRGAIGPFEGNGTPRYELRSVSFDAVPVEGIPGAPTALSGELSFHGRLDSRGDGLDAVLSNASGEGELRVAQGTLAGGNLDRQLIAALSAQLAPPATADGEPLIALAQQSPALSSLLAAQSTAFTGLGGVVRIDPSAVRFADLALDTASLRVQAEGSLGRSGQLALAGTAALERTASMALAGLAPQVRPLLDADQRLALPFKAEGSWPKLKIALDVHRALALATGRLVLPSLLAGLAPQGASGPSRALPPLG